MAVRKRKTRLYEPWGYMDENNYQSTEIIEENELEKVLASANYNEDDKKIHFFNLEGKELKNSAIDTSDFAGSAIESATYDKETKTLTIVFSNGDIVEINFEDIVVENEFGDGLQVVDAVVSVKIKDNDEYLTVDSNGISSAPLKSVINEITNKIQEEKQRAINAENALQTAIDEEEERAKTVEQELSDRIDEIASGASIEKLDELIERLGYTDNDTLVRNGEHEVAFGQYNISNTSDEPSGRTIFSVGIGTDDDNRSNAIEIRENGDVYMWVEGDFMNVNKLLGQIAHEVYDGDSTHNSSHFFDGN